MKKIFTMLTIFVFIQGLWSCKKTENQSKDNFTLDQLYQTAWRGNLTVYKDGETTEHNISLLFYGTKIGSFEIKSLGDGPFEYITEGKAVQISSTCLTGAPTQLYGIYMLLDKLNKDRISLKSKIHSETYYQILELQRIY